MLFSFLMRVCDKKKRDTEEEEDDAEKESLV